jgi:2-oxoglutarate/2-oxoacid ferredoxin oxidoreductase subunit beta
MEQCVVCTTETAWCTGCGNFDILNAIKKALGTLSLEPHSVLLVGGIGQAAKVPQYINTNGFCGLHGRALPAAAAAKIVNSGLTVIVSTGDGDSYGEGGNHFIHNIRRNADITHLVHDNQIYGLTKGQASPTTDPGQITDAQPFGTINAPFNPIAAAVALGAGFVARAFSGEREHLAEIIAAAVRHSGYALVDILQPCISFNKINTFQWYMHRVYKLDGNYDPSNKADAFAKALEWGERIPIGIIYKEDKPAYNDKVAFLKEGKPLVGRTPDLMKVREYIKDFE